MRRYLDLVRVPLLGRLYAASLLARLPMGINGLAVVLLLREERGSFAIAGATAGALALGTGLGAPFAARLIDRLGPRLLLAYAAVHAGGLLGLVALAGAPVGDAAVLAVALVTGVAFPPSSSVQRVQYPRLLSDRPELLQTAFALDSVIVETVFTAGPLLTAAIAVLLGPGAVLVFSATAIAVGVPWLLSALPSSEGPAQPASRSRLGALAAPGIRTLVGSMLPVGFAFGSLEVALPAFADAEGSPELAGVLIALWSAGSMAGGIVYGSRPRRARLDTVHLRVAVLLPLSFLPLALAFSPLVMALLAPLAGVLIAPLIATRNELAGAVAPAGAQTEAYTWPLTALVSGIALGAAAAGAISDASGWQAAVLVAAGAAAAGAAVAAGRRTTLAPVT